MPSASDTPSAEAIAPTHEAPKFELDFDSDEPLPVCPMRKDGSASDESCEACQ